MGKPSTDKEDHVKDNRSQQDRFPAMRSNAKANAACFALLVAELDAIFPSYPFELSQREQTRPRYYSIHERFLCYIFRVLALSRNIKEPINGILGLQLTTAQLAMMI